MVGEEAGTEEGDNVSDCRRRWNKFQWVKVKNKASSPGMNRSTNYSSADRDRHNTVLARTGWRGWLSAVGSLGD